MNEVLIQALLVRVKAGLMEPEQVPIPYQEIILQRLEGGGIEQQ